MEKGKKPRPSQTQSHNIVSTVKNFPRHSFNIFFLSLCLQQQDQEFKKQDEQVSLTWFFFIIHRPSKADKDFGFSMGFQPAAR